MILITYKLALLTVHFLLMIAVGTLIVSSHCCVVAQSKVKGHHQKMAICIQKG